MVCEQCGLRLARRERVGEAFVQSLAAGRTDRREHRVANERVRERESFGAELGEEALAAEGLHDVEELLGRDRRARLDGRELELLAGDRRERERRREIAVERVEAAGDELGDGVGNRTRIERSLRRVRIEDELRDVERIAGRARFELGRDLAARRRPA